MKPPLSFQRTKDMQTIDTALRNVGVTGLAALKKKDFSAQLVHLLMSLFDISVDPLAKLQVAKALVSAPEKDQSEIERFFLDRYKNLVGKLDEFGVDSLAWGLANFLEIVSAGRAQSLSEYISLARDVRFGATRQMIVIALAKHAKNDVEDLLIELLDDQGVIGHAVIALGKIKSKKSFSKLEAVRKSTKVAWIKKEAVKSMSAIQKAPDKI